MNFLLVIILSALLGYMIFLGLCYCLVFLSCCCLDIFVRMRLHMYPDRRHPQYQREEAQGRSAAATLGDGTTATGYESDDVAEDRSSGSGRSRSRGRSGDACADEAAPSA